MLNYPNFLTVLILLSLLSKRKRTIESFPIHFYLICFFLHLFFKCIIEYSSSGQIMCVIISYQVFLPYQNLILATQAIDRRACVHCCYIVCKNQSIFIKHIRAQKIKQYICQSREEISLFRSN